MNDKNLSGKSGVAARINELFRIARRHQPVSAPGVLTHVSPRGTSRRAIVKTTTTTEGTSGWL